MCRQDCDRPRVVAATLVPFVLTVAIIVVDQLTKWLIVRQIPQNTIGWSFWDGLVRIVHVRNLGIAFSIGRDLPAAVRLWLFAIVPQLVLFGIVVYYIRTDQLSTVQRWSVAGIVGGGIGNLIDRVFQPAGVVDFVDVRFFGIFGLERWPTFNVADASVVICGILLVVTTAIHPPDPGLRQRESSARGDLDEQKS